jgi:hypothetical protein
MVRRNTATSLFLILVGSNLTAGEHPQVQELRREIKLLHGQREQTIKSIHAQYEAILRRDERTEKEKIQIREALARQEREALRAAKLHEERALKQIHEHYDFLIHRDKHSEKELEHKRRALTRQEWELLSVATTDRERERIRGWYDAMRRRLTKEIHADEKELAELRSHEQAHLDHVRHAYAEERERIKKRIRYLLSFYTNEIRLDERQIRELRAAERVHVEQVRAVHDAKIREMEAAIRHLNAQPKGPPPGPAKNVPPKKK